MGVAFGRFEPTEAFYALRGQMEPSRRFDGTVQDDLRSLAGLSAKTADGIALECSHVEVLEGGEFSNPFEREVSCVGIAYPLYEELFPHHVKAYHDQFKK